MELNFLASKKRTIMLVIAIAYTVINTITVLLVFNTEFFYTIDKQIYGLLFIFVALGICVCSFFLVLKFLEKLTIKKLILIFLITRFALFLFVTTFNYSVEIDFPYFIHMAERVLEGQIFTPYNPIWLTDYWRIIWPPLWMWWYSYNFWVYALDTIIWRFVNILLEIGIVYVMIKIFQENYAKTNENYFKIGLAFYIFSIFPIVGIIMFANITAFPVLLGLVGFLFYFRSKKDPKNLYFAIFFFCLCALTEFFAAIWIFAILLLLLFKKEIKRFLLLGIEVVLVFCLVCLPLLINDAPGFMGRLFWAQSSFANSWDGTIWTVPDPILNLIPTLLAVAYCTIYVYKNQDKQYNLSFFIVGISIFLFFSPFFAPWHYLWILPLLSITIINSFRKYIIANIFFIAYLATYFGLFAIGFLVYPYGLSGFHEIAYNQVKGYMDSTGYFIILQLVGHLFFHMGFIYLIYSYTAQKKWIYALILPYIPYYIINILFFI